MNTYPGIYKALDGTIYYYLNKNNFFSPERNRWEEDCDNDDHKTDVNITRECLENTYGKVESKEHADFLIKLAEKNKIELGIDGYSERKNYFYFTEDEGLLHLVFASFSPSNKHISITIPLPPKEPEPKEWPQVGSAALTPSKQKACVLAIHGGEAWVKYEGTPIGTGYASLRVATLSKPPTPEEELAKDILDYFNEVSSSMRYTVSGNKLIVEELMQKYDIKKKPE